MYVEIIRKAVGYVEIEQGRGDPTRYVRDTTSNLVMWHQRPAQATGSGIKTQCNHTLLSTKMHQFAMSKRCVWVRLFQASSLISDVVSTTQHTLALP